jgi:hypothetical protein
MSDTNSIPLKFNLKEPIPKFDVFPSYREAQLHSREVDEWLGLLVDETEMKIARNPELTQFDQREQWVGLNPDALQTPYTECRTILDLIQIKPNQALVDLGAGYARMGFVMGLHFADSKYIGYEICADRVIEAKRILNQHHFSNVQLEHQDIARLDFMPPDADFYFVYDFGTAASIHKILQNLKQIARRRQQENKYITVIARGRGARDQIEKHEPWLSEVHEPKVYPHFSIYRS